MRAAIDYPHLTDSQRDFIATALPGARLIADLSWHLVDSYVLHCVSGNDEVIIKAGGADNHHIGREISAHDDGALQALIARSAAPQLIAADREARILCAEFLPGTLVEGTASEAEPGISEQAGELLRALHSASESLDESIERHMRKKALQWLNRPHRIPPAQADRAGEILRTHRPEPVIVVPSHGDFSPRNWIVCDGRVALIDFGRFGHRPAVLDFLRIAGRQWRTYPATRAAFYRGYGLAEGIESSPQWIMAELREAIATAAWAYKVGDEAFEREGRQRLSAVLARANR